MNTIQNGISMRLVAKIAGGQDGAIFGDELFRFDHRGGCRVYRMPELLSAAGGSVSASATFTLDRASEFVPHSNAVFFGCERYEEGDEFPLLYSNVYNNYAGKEEPYMGVCCVYRLTRTAGGFETALVQLIKIGFCEDPTLWKAHPDRHEARPYGNFLIDRDTGRYYAFVMRANDEARYFTFRTPSVREGEILPALGVRQVTLAPADILSYFDAPPHRYIQGATAHGGLIYSTEGFSGHEILRPTIRVIDPAAGRELASYDLISLGYTDEAEMIDFYHGVCYYSDAHGYVYAVTREGDADGTF